MPNTMQLSYSITHLVYWFQSSILFYMHSIELHMDHVNVFISKWLQL